MNDKQYLVLAAALGLREISNLELVGGELGEEMSEGRRESVCILPLPHMQDAVISQTSFLLIGTPFAR